MPSPIDKIYEEIFGALPEKAGTAFEHLASIASYVLNEGDVTHDDKLRGQFSNTLYQLDVHDRSVSGSTMVEAKDYSDQGKKVGRGDLQKLGGALPDLKEIDSGAFFSATEYTTPAKKYADSAHEMFGKSISLWELRPGTERDEEGFIKTVAIQLHILMPQPEKATWIPHFTKHGESELKASAKPGDDRVEFQTGLRCFYDGLGNEVLSLYELTSNGYGEIHSDTGLSHGCFVLKGCYIEVDGVLAEVTGLEFELPYQKYTEELRITDDSGHRFVLLDKDGNVTRFLTDRKLREFDFDEDGRLIKR